MTISIPHDAAHTSKQSLLAMAPSYMKLIRSQFIPSELESTMSCLDIPIPLCVRNLLREPPICYPGDNDCRALDHIGNFGAEYGCSEAEIEQACNLASGASDLMVILERPRAGQNFALAFHEFVRDCPTLRAVDELIRYASKGARSIHTVSVVDAFCMVPNHRSSIPTERCHQLLEEILRLKAPQVVICCWTGLCQNKLASKFRSCGVGTWRLSDQVEIWPTSTTVIRSFHPATAVCYRKRSACTRMLLICQFALAFAELSGAQERPLWIREICQRSANETNDHSLNELQNTAAILHILRGTLSKKTRLVKVNDSKEARICRQRSRINQLLGLLFSSDYCNGAFAIANLCLTWSDYSHPEKTGVLVRLQEIGQQQKMFLQEDSKVLVGSKSHIRLVEPVDDGNSNLALHMKTLKLEDLPIATQ